MLANNLTQLIGLIAMTAAMLFGFLKGIQLYFETDAKKQEYKTREAIELARAQVDLAKNNSLTAAQVAEILKNYNEVIKELENMKNNNQDKNEDILEMIDKIEIMVKEQTQNFTKFIMDRAKL